MSTVTNSSPWQRLVAEAEAARAVPIAELLARDEQRVERLTGSVGGITVDASKTRLTPAAETALHDLAVEADVAGWRERMFAGEAVNTSEGRAALHAALRTPEIATARVAGEAVGSRVRATYDAVIGLAEAVRTGELRGATGAAFTDVVNIGIGGSDLGPRLACEALAGDAPLRMHFIANIDPHARQAVLADLDPTRTLVIVASKTFTTLETLANARALRQWLAAALPANGVGRHLVAVTGAGERAAAFGVASERILDLPDWVGGRYSVWSAVGLPVAMAGGGAVFDELLAGAAEMDRHFRQADPAVSLPLRLALVGIWHGNFLGARSHVVVPYSERLARLPEYLQQLELESNGKSVDRDGEPLDYATAPALWGTVGTTAQHAFFQWLHQGTEAATCDLIAVLGGGEPDADVLAANCLAQAAALMAGVSERELEQAGVPPAERAFRRLPGDRPSTVILLDRLDARTLGALVALYEHKVFCQAVIWRINPFDQWGVERGKALARVLVPALSTGEADGDVDPSTVALLRRYRAAGRET